MQSGRLRNKHVLAMYEIEMDSGIPSGRIYPKEVSHRSTPNNISSPFLGTSLSERRL